MILFFNKWIIVIPNEVRNLVKILRHCVPQNDKRKFSVTFTNEFQKAVRIKSDCFFHAQKNFFVFGIDI